MKPEHSIDSLVIPPDLLPQIHAAAEEKRLSAGDVLREILERGFGDLRRQSHSETERQRAWELGIADDDDNQPMTDEYRRSFHGKIMPSLQSLREGKGKDGEALHGRDAGRRPYPAFQPRPRGPVPSTAAASLT